MAEGAASGLRRIVLFDFDGVLVRGDAFRLLMRAHYSRQRWRSGLALLAAPWLLMVLPFSRRRVSRALVRLGLLGVGESRYRQLAKCFAVALARQPGRFCRQGLRVLRQHQIAGDRIVVVTGCDESLVRGVLASSVVNVEVLASRLRAGRFGMRPGCTTSDRARWNSWPAMALKPATSPTATRIRICRCSRSPPKQSWSMPRPSSASDRKVAGPHRHPR